MATMSIPTVTSVAALLLAFVVAVLAEEPTAAPDPFSAENFGATYTRLAQCAVPSDDIFKRRVSPVTSQVLPSDFDTFCYPGSKPSNVRLYMCSYYNKIIEEYFGQFCSEEQKVMHTFPQPQWLAFSSDQQQPCQYLTEHLTYQDDTNNVLRVFSDRDKCEVTCPRRNQFCLGFALALKVVQNSTETQDVAGNDDTAGHADGAKAQAGQTGSGDTSGGPDEQTPQTGLDQINQKVDQLPDGEVGDTPKDLELNNPTYAGDKTVLQGEEMNPHISSLSGGGVAGGATPSRGSQIPIEELLLDSPRGLDTKEKYITGGEHSVAGLTAEVSPPPSNKGVPDDSPPEGVADEGQRGGNDEGNKDAKETLLPLPSSSETLALGGTTTLDQNDNGTTTVDKQGETDAADTKTASVSQTSGKPLSPSGTGTGTTTTGTHGVANTSDDLDDGGPFNPKDTFEAQFDSFSASDDDSSDGSVFEPAGPLEPRPADDQLAPPDIPEPAGPLEPRPADDQLAPPDIPEQNEVPVAPANDQDIYQPPARPPADSRPADYFEREKELRLLEEESSSHFLAYTLTAIILIMVTYILYHNKQKIVAIIVEGKGSNGRRRRYNQNV